MAFRVTQCPGCDSTFNTGPGVLAAAAGKVRCGACLTVFDAAENFIGDEQVEAAESVFVSAAPGDYFDPSNFLTRSALLEPEPGFLAQDDESLEFFAAVSDTLDETDREEPEREATEWEATGREDAQREEVEEAATAIDLAPQWSGLYPDAHGFAAAPWQAGTWSTGPGTDSPPTEPEASEPNTDVTGDPEPPRGSDVPESFSLHFKFTLSHALQPAVERPDPTAISLSYSGSLEAPGVDTAGAALAEFNEELEAQDFEDTVAGALDAEETGTEAPASTPPVDGSDYYELDGPEPSLDTIRARALQADLRDEDELEAIPRENLATLGQFTPPVEFLAGRRRHWRRQAGWTALALLLAFFLAGQYLWQGRTLYSQSPQLRPLYAWVCELAGCELPAYADIDAIRSDILTVRSHPQIDNALAVNVEFRNTAPFPQPFPIMVLSFNSTTNNIIALREFAPAEYLGTTLARRELMPVMNPVQVNLEIIDPGPDAVNYTLGFRRP